MRSLQLPFPALLSGGDIVVPAESLSVFAKEPLSRCIFAGYLDIKGRIRCEIDSAIPENGNGSSATLSNCSHSVMLTIDMICLAVY